MLPLHPDPTSLYKTIITYSFSPQEIDSLVNSLNPLQDLRESLGRFTLSSLLLSNREGGTQKKWFIDYAFGFFS